MPQDNYNTKRVHQVNIGLTIILVFLVCIPVILSKGLSESIIFIIAGLFVLVISTTTYFLPINTYAKGFILSLLPCLIVTVLFVVDGYALNKHYILLLTIAMVTLYFKKELILTLGVLLNIAYIILFFIDSEKLLGINHDVKGFITVVFVMDGIVILLYLLTKWGRQL